MSVGNSIKNNVKYTRLECECNKPHEFVIEGKEDSNESINIPTDCINYNDYPQNPWYSDLVINFLFTPYTTIPDFVTTYTESLLKKTYSDDTLYTVATGEIDREKKFIYLVHGRNGHPTDLEYISIYLKEMTECNVILTYIPNSRECSISSGARVIKSIISDTYGDIEENCEREFQ